MVTIGIDPGQTGAIAVCIEGDWAVFDCPVLTVETTNRKTKSGKSVKNTPDPAGMAALLEKCNYEGAHAYIEKVGAAPGQGVTSMFNFGKGYGMWLGILAALKIPYTLVTPQAWKKAMMAGMAKEKAASIVRATQLFPEMADRLTLKKHDGRAEALLIAEYGRRMS